MSTIKLHYFARQKSHGHVAVVQMVTVIGDGDTIAKREYIGNFEFKDANGALFAAHLIAGSLQMELTQAMKTEVKAIAGEYKQCLTN